MAVTATTKRCYRIFVQRKYKQELMPAAFRCADHVAQLAGADVVMTIHPKIQEMIIVAEKAGDIRREIAIDNPIDEAIVKRVGHALPEFYQAYEESGLLIEEFDTFGATQMTLTGFDVMGWQKLGTMS